MTDRLSRWVLFPTTGKVHLRRRYLTPPEFWGQDYVQETLCGYHVTYSDRYVRRPGGHRRCANCLRIHEANPGNTAP